MKRDWQRKNYFEDDGVLTHYQVGQISECMREWQGRIADELGLTPTDVDDIKMMHPFRLTLQTYGINLRTYGYVL